VAVKQTPVLYSTCPHRLYDTRCTTYEHRILRKFPENHSDLRERTIRRRLMPLPNPGEPVASELRNRQSVVAVKQIPALYSICPHRLNDTRQTTYEHRMMNTEFFRKFSENHCDPREGAARGRLMPLPDRREPVAPEVAPGSKRSSQWWL